MRRRLGVTPHLEDGERPIFVDGSAQNDGVDSFFFAGEQIPLLDVANRTAWPGFSC